MEIVIPQEAIEINELKLSLLLPSVLQGLFSMCVFCD